MIVGSLFSGIGGIELGLGLPVAWHVENDPHASSVLERHFPGVPNLGDITRIDWRGVEPVDVLVGGPPCQPISSAGQRKGAEDNRWLWPFAIDAIRALGPRFFLLENPTDLLGFPEWRDVLGALAADGRYEVRWDVFRACDVGGSHERERVFIFGALADARSERVPPQGCRGVSGAASSGSSEAPERQRLRAGAVNGRPTPADADRPHRPTPRDAFGGDCPATDGGRGATQSRGRYPVTPDADSAGCPLIGGSVLARDRAWGDADGRDGEGLASWGIYASAIARWERAFGRPAPSPVDERGRLNVPLVEWLMGLPEGWVDGIPRTAALRCLGNAVLPQVAALAWAVLAGESQ